MQAVRDLLILAAEEGAEESGEGIDLLIPETSELIAGILAFILIFIVVWKWALPALNAMLERRQHAVRADLESAEQAKQEAEALLKDYQAQLAGAREEANRIVEEARQSGESVRADIVARAEEEAAAIKQRAEEDVAGERDRLAASMQREVASLSLDVAEKVLGESLDGEAQRRLVDRYIQDLGGVGG